MYERTTGLILRTRPLTETSLIVHWLTRDFGRLATVAKGARRPKSPFCGKLDLFYLAEFSFARSRRSELHVLTDVSLQDTHNELRQELAYLRQAAYLAALIEQSTETETPLRSAFDLITGLLDDLPKQPPQPRTLLAFETKWLDLLGLKPDFQKTDLSKGARQILENFVETDWQRLSRLKLSQAQLTEIRQFLHGFLIYHLGRIPKGRTIQLENSGKPGT
jgi:DNA repair protein RecO (recombination protein O)